MNTDWDYIKRLGGEGILTRQDVSRLRNQRERVLYMMLDGDWHTADEIIRSSGGREGLRRMRELREIPNITIERRRKGNDYQYKLVYKSAAQRELFG